MNAANRVLSVDGMLKWRESVKLANERVVLTNGCFDLIHVGHLRCLEYAGNLGDRLVVAINSDLSVKELKGGGRPLVTELDRAELVAGFECVDRVVIFSEKRLTNVIDLLSPDIYAKGGDYNLETMDQGERMALDECGAEILFFDVVAGRSTTNLIEKIRIERNE